MARWLHPWRRRSAGEAEAATPAGVEALQRARAFVATGRFDAALDVLQSLDDTRRAEPSIQMLTGIACAHAGRPAEALAALDVGAPIALRDSHARALVLDAVTALCARPDVERIARDIAERLPPTALIALVIGRCCLARSAPDDAEPWLRRAVGRDPHDAAAWSALGLALRRQDRDTEALAAYEASERATATGREDVDAFTDVAYMLQRMGRFDDARQVLESGLATRPSIAAHRGYAEVLLTLGELDAGFDHYEFRWMAAPLCATRLGPVRPPWRGEPLAGKTILLRVEQGYGDTFQFLRYVEHVKRLGATIVMRRFSDLVDEMPEVDIALRDGDAVPYFDYYANLGSLPRVFATTLKTIPAHVPYLRAPASMRDAWKTRIPPFDGLNVGLAWAGAALPDPRRSVAIDALRPLLDVPGVRFFGLQKGVPDHDVLAASDGRIRPLGVDFAETAAAIEALDLVISIDTSIAHLAGALGKPVWTMLVQNADWRWMANRDDSPWYPTMRLFRQQRRGDWAPVIAEVAQALADAAERPAALGTPVPGARHAHPSPLQPVAPNLRRPLRFTRVVETRYGIVHHRGDDGTESLSLEHYGEHLQAQLAHVERLVGPGSVVIDVAPGIGAHALALASVIGGEGRHVLVERRAFERRLLRHNFSANQVRAQFTVLDDVPESADAGLEALGLARLDLLRIGPGADAAQTLRTCEPLIWRFRPSLFAALADARALPPLIDALRQLGYCAWRIETPLFDPDNFFGRPDDVFDGRRALAVMAGPEESARPLLDEPPMLAY